MTTTLTIKAKQCGPNSSITEEIANKLYANKGSRILIIAEVKSDTTHESIDGDRKVDGILENIEVVIAANADVDAVLEEHVRNLHSKLYRNRKIAEGDPELEFDGDTAEPSTTDLVQQGQPFVTDPDNDLVPS